MILQEQKSRTYKEKPYYKRWVVIPNDIIDKLSWFPKQKLKATIKNNKLIIEKT